MEQARADAGAQPLARSYPGTPSPARGGRAAAPAALHHPGQYEAAELRALRVKAGRVAGIVPALPRQRAAQGFRSARHADPGDAAKGAESLRAELTGKERGRPARISTSHLGLGVVEVAGGDDFAIAVPFGQGEADEGFGDGFGRGQGVRVLAGEDAGAELGADGAGAEEVGTHARRRDLGGVGF